MKKSGRGGTVRLILSLYKKNPYYSLLDALSKTTAHPSKTNKERIIGFVKTFCGWSNCEKISLPHLIGLLKKYPDPELSELRSYAFSQQSSWGHVKVIRLDRNPDIQGLKKHYPKEFPKHLGKISDFERLQHVTLFYTYRNSLIHEMRRPSGTAPDFPDDTEPLYYSVMDLRTKTSTWRLVYPLKFFETITQNAIINLKKYYLENSINPYEFFKREDSWIEESN